MYSWFGRENKLLEQDLELPTFPAFIVNLVSILSINLVGRVATMWGSHTQFMIQPGKRQPGDHLKGMKLFFFQPQIIQLQIAYPYLHYIDCQELMP